MGHRVAEVDPSLRWRIISAVAFAPAVLALVVWGVWPFAFLVAIAVVLLAIEWRHLMAALFDQRTGDLAGLATGLCALLIVAMAAVGWHVSAIGMIGICLGIAAIAAPLLRIVPAWPFVGIAYLGLPMLAMIWLRGLPEVGLNTLLWLLLVVWATDIMAYFVGRQIGGRRLAPSISPGKDLGGAFGRHGWCGGDWRAGGTGDRTLPRPSFGRSRGWSCCGRTGR